MPNPFDQFRGSPIDWDNILNMTTISEVALSNPEQMRAQIRASSIDPNDLLGVGSVLSQLSFRDHAKVALEEAICQLEANPIRVAADVKPWLVNAKRNVCAMCMPTAPLESFRWIVRDPQIAQVDPGLALQVASALKESDHYAEAAAVLKELDEMPIETLAALFPDAEAGARAIRALRISVRGTLCKRIMRADPLAAYSWIVQEPGIVQADPKLALGIVSFLTRMDRFEEAGVVFVRVDQLSDRTLLDALEGSPLGIEGIGCMRFEVYKRTRFKGLPPRWDMEPGDFEEHAAIVEEGLQRRVGLGQSDTLVNLSLLAITGDRRAIPLFVRALSHHKRDIQREAALGLYLHGEARGFQWLMSEDPNEGVFWTLRLLRDPVAEKRVADWDKR